jgi:hypothetical protein
MAGAPTRAAGDRLRWRRWIQSSSRHRCHEHRHHVPHRPSQDLAAD